MELHLQDGKPFYYCVHSIIHTVSQVWSIWICHILDDDLVHNVSLVSLATSRFDYYSVLIKRFRRGLAIEAMITILTPRFIPFFLILWIIGESIPPSFLVTANLIPVQATYPRRSTQLRCCQVYSNTATRRRSTTSRGQY